MRFHFLLFPTLLLLLLGGCKKEELPYSPPDGSYGLIYTKIFATSCALSACHDGGDGAASPNLDGKTAFAAISNTTPANSQAASAGLKLVDSADPDNSFLYQKLIFDSTAFAFGSEMPAGGLTLSADQIAFVRAWIAAGAPESGHVADRSLIE